MSNRKRFRAVHKIVRQSWRRLSKTTQNLMNRLLRGLLGLGRTQRRHQATAGFVLPTAVMMMLVVALLVTAMVLRSFDRSKNASNVRVNEVTLNAAAPALERAKAKIDKVFENVREGTPPDDRLLTEFNANINKYTFGDEIPLKLVYDFDNGVATDGANPDNNIQALNGTSKQSEVVRTAWKFPVDTDNNGKFDSFTLYTILLRIPDVDGSGNLDRSRNPLDARTPPMDEIELSRCAGNANVAAAQDWYKVNDKLKKSLFVYTANVPITAISDLDTAKYEVFPGGNQGFTALEYQQDRTRIPLANNAVVYEDDLEILPGQGLVLNGRVFTNSNFLFGQTASGEVKLRLVSSPASCYYEEEASKIIVGGNLANGRVNDPSDQNAAKVDLFRGKGIAPSENQPVDSDTKSTTATGGSLVAYNTEAYEQRIRFLADAARRLPAADLPVPANELESYFRKRTRRVPYSEVATGNSALIVGSTPVTAPADEGQARGFFGLQRYSGEADPTGINPLRPPNEWMYPVNPTVNNRDDLGAGDGNNYAKLQFRPIRPKATAPSLREGKEWPDRVGDRILIGNNLPEFVYNTQTGLFTKNAEVELSASQNKWHTASGGGLSGITRTRTSRVTTLDELGALGRDGFWEKKAAEAPKNPTSLVGGLRVVTGGGIYLPANYPATGLPTPVTPPPVTPDRKFIIWPDFMPIPDTGRTDVVDETGKALIDPTNDRPYLRMRAAAVYHFDKDSPTGGPGDIAYDPNNPSYNPNIPVPDANNPQYQRPIACVSSYYDPTSKASAENKSGLPDNPTVDGTATAEARSNNGVVYGWPGPSDVNASKADLVGFLGNGAFGSNYRAILTYQASLKSSNGRLVNPTLKSAIDKVVANTPETLTLAETTALDTGICALSILSGAAPAPQPFLQHGDIYETSFLDARQVKAIEGNNAAISDYDLSIEERQPLEVRATVLDLDRMRQRTFGSSSPTQEYLIPNSGIIYAAREDAQMDQSSAQGAGVSAADSILDPERRPNAIMLVNGSDLSRAPNNEYRREEKGLILATELPVYIKGDFNLHSSGGEFSDTGSSFYQRATPNQSFACRRNQTRCVGDGDRWRPTTVLADAITLLSSDFRFGFRDEGDYDLRNNHPANPTTTLPITPARPPRSGNEFVNYDLNGDGTIAATQSVVFSETTFPGTPDAPIDLNGNGNTTDTSVTLTETQVPARVARRLNGFYDNNFATSRDFTDADYRNTARLTGADLQKNSSYFNNFVTPVQRRVDFPEYLMEVCKKLPVSQCGPGDWYVDPDATTPLKAKDVVGQPYSLTTHKAGTTVDAADPTLRRYPRRVAFLRNTDNQLVANDGTTLLTATARPVVLGINAGGNIDKYSTDGTSTPRTRPNALWFRTFSGGSRNWGNGFVINASRVTADASGAPRLKDQPLVAPVLQLQAPNSPIGNSLGNFVSNVVNTSGAAGNQTNWMQHPPAAGNTYNLVIAAGDTPGRPFDNNGGLANYPRFLESWNPGTNAGSAIPTRINGSFIQLKRSVYTPAPFRTLIPPTTVGGVTLGTYDQDGGIFNYRQKYRKLDDSTNVIPHHEAPSRVWGFDVALLTQSPDLFSTQFTLPPENPPNEFFRQVSRDDPWVAVLLCAAQRETAEPTAPTPNAPIPGGYVNAAAGDPGLLSTYFNEPGKNYKFAVSRDQRPNCTAQPGTGGVLRPNS